MARSIRDILRDFDRVSGQEQRFPDPNEPMSKLPMMQEEPEMDTAAEQPNEILDRNPEPKQEVQEVSPEVEKVEKQVQEMMESTEEPEEEDRPETEDQKKLRYASYLDAFNKILDTVDKAGANLAARNVAYQMAGGGQPVRSGVDVSSDFFTQEERRQQARREEERQRLREILNARYKQGVVEASQQKQELDRRRFEESQQLRREKLEERQKAEERRQERQDFEKRNKLLDASRKLKDADPVYKKSLEQASEFNTVNSLIRQVEDGNEQALAALGTKLARAMGEVGVLTDSDVVRYVGSTSWGRKLQDWFKKGAQGTLPEDTLSDMKGSISAISKELKDNTEKVYGQALKRFTSTFPDEDPQDLAQIMGTYDYVFDEDSGQVMETYTPAQEKGIERVMERNNLDRQQAIDALKKAGKL